MGKSPARSVPALKVHQWIKEWNQVEFSSKEHRRKPSQDFYIFSLGARDLKALSGIQRREKTLGPEPSLGIQRRHEKDRSEEIGRFVRHGYPWSSLPEAKRDSPEFRHFLKPGWLPTAVVVNILTDEDQRRGLTVSKADRITIASGDGAATTISLPSGLAEKGWKPSPLYPLEVIDGQHRLWAFDDKDIPDDFELPVVAFYGLDVSWQAYLFWTINIKPKKINTSLAFDLYPLLRSEDWLEKFEGHSIYRETRAQELVERLWSTEASPWYQHINMLGDPGTRMLSQAAWIRSLTATYVRAFEGRRVQVGGLFGAPVGEDRTVLPWNREQQAVFLIYVWRELQKAVRGCDEEWAVQLRSGNTNKKSDPAFRGPYTLIDQDQGIRTILHVTNDICYITYKDLRLSDWTIDAQESSASTTELLKSLEKQPVARFISEAARILAEFDWRAATAPSLSSAERQAKLVFRGSGGYSEFRRQLLSHMSEYKGRIGEAATEVLQIIS